MLSLATEFGGQGLGLAEEVLFGELAAKANAPDSLARVGKILTAPALLLHGTQQQKDRFLPRIVSGQDVWCQGFSEPGSGSDLASATCAARRVEGGYRVTGRKVWTSFAEVYFDGVFVAESDRLGAEGEGWRVAMTILTAERGGVETVTRYVDMRSDMDKLLACCVPSGGMRAQAEDLDVEVELIRRQVAKAVERESDEAAFNRATCFLKVLWSDLWQRVTTLGLDSGCGAHREHWNFQYLEVKGTTIYSGTKQIQRNIIAERVLGLPK